MGSKSMWKFVNIISSIRRFSKKPTEPSISGLGRKAKKLLAEGMEKKTKVKLESDAKKLVSEVCGTNLLVEGGENIKIKPDSEYPDWLWNIPLGREVLLEEMDPNSKEYWNRVNYIGRKQEALLKKFQKHKTLQK